MATSIVYGNAFPDTRDDNAHIRQYVKGGEVWTGYDTDDIAHYCDRLCARNDLAGWEPTDDADVWIRREGGASDHVATADIGSADYGDDPYVECATCGEVLYRNDDAYEATYGERLADVLARNATHTDENN